VKDEEELEEEDLPEEGDDEELFFTEVISEAMYEFFAVAKYHAASFYGADIPDYEEGIETRLTQAKKMRMTRTMTS
jgi:hypothetical protein